MQVLGQKEPKTAHEDMYNDNTASITQIFKCLDSTTNRRVTETGYLQITNKTK